MNVIVCVKQVPEIAHVKVDSQANKIIHPEGPGVMNPFDAYAVEEAIRIKEKLGGKVIAVSLGAQGEYPLREALALGADEAYLLTDPLFSNSDAYVTAYILSQGIKKIGEFDLILCGKQAVDGDASQVPASLAEWLKIPQVIFVKKIESLQNGQARVFRMTEDGYEVVETKLPALFSVVKEINEPRLPSLKGKMKAKSVKIITWNASELGISEKQAGISGSKVLLQKVFSPPLRLKGEIIEGTSSEDIAEKLFNKLRENQIL